MPSSDRYLERLEALESRMDDCGRSAEDRAIDKEIRDAFRAWKLAGRAVRWVVAGLATAAAAVTAWRVLIGEIKRWLIGD